MLLTARTEKYGCLQTNDGNKILPISHFIQYAMLSDVTAPYSCVRGTLQVSHIDVNYSRKALDFSAETFVSESYVYDTVR